MWCIKIYILSTLLMVKKKMECSLMLLQIQLQTTKLGVILRLAPQQCIESFMKWISIAQQLQYIHALHHQCQCSVLKSKSSIDSRAVETSSLERPIKLFCLAIRWKSLGLAVYRRKICASLQNTSSVFSVLYCSKQNMQVIIILACKNFHSVHALLTSIMTSTLSNMSILLA